MSLLALIKNSKIIVISKKSCRYCVKLKELLNSKNITYVNINVEDYMEKFDDDDFIFDEIEQLKGQWNITSYPMTFIDNEFIGDYTTIEKMNAFGNFDILLKNKNINYISPNDDEF